MTRNAELPLWPMVLLYIAGSATLLQAVAHVIYGVFCSAPKVTEIYAIIQSLVHVAVLLVLLVIFSATTFFVRYNIPEVNPVILESDSLD